MSTEILDPDRRTRLDNIYTLSGLLDKFAGSGTSRDHAAAEVRQLIDIWRTIDANFAAKDVGLADTPEEIRKWEEAVYMAGSGILALAQLLLEEDV